MTGKRRRWRTRGAGNGVRPRRHRSPANRVRHDDLRWSARVADRVTAVFDPYPFILLNLLFSTQAAYAGPLILLSQNRTAERDRVKAEHDFDVNVLALRALAELLGDVHDQHAQQDLQRRINALLGADPGDERSVTDDRAEAAYEESPSDADRGHSEENPLLAQGVH